MKITEILFRLAMVRDGQRKWYCTVSTSFPFEFSAANLCADCAELVWMSVTESFRYEYYVILKESIIHYPTDLIQLIVIHLVHYYLP